MRRSSPAGDKLGKITGIHMHMYRNTPHGKPQWSRPVYPDMTPENMLWNSFQGEAPKHPFDANRYINWRFFWDYSGGNFYENMCHQVAFWYKVLDLQIPKSVTASGGVYLWKDGREVPDTMSVSMVQPEEMLMHVGFGIRQQRARSDARKCWAPTARFREASRSATRRRKSTGRTERRSWARRGRRRPAHMQNFLEFDSRRMRRRIARSSSGIEVVDRVPDGGGQLPARARGHLGRAEGTDRLSQLSGRRRELRQGSSASIRTAYALKAFGETFQVFSSKYRTRPSR